jgi:hypothetical protein
MVFRTSFTVLFLAYPGVSLKVLRLFKCREVNGTHWLEADMRLQCFNSQWAGYAFYGLLVAVLYIAGLPLGACLACRGWWTAGGSVPQAACPPGTLCVFI